MRIILKIFKSLLPFGIISGFRKYKLMKEKVNYEKQLSATIQGSGILKLEIGSGPVKGRNGWLTADILHGCDMQMNLLNPFPLADNSVEEIYSSHFLEHFTTNEIITILRECYRVLKPGGAIRSCVPNAKIFINAYCKNEVLDESFIVYEPAKIILSKIDYINYIGNLNDQHKHLFDIENLIAIHKFSGFDSAEQTEFGHELDLKEREYESIYVHARKAV